MELELWQYICLVLFAIAVLAGVIIYAKGIISKVIASIIWVIIALFLLTQFFEVA